MTFESFTPISKGRVYIPAIISDIEVKNSVSVENALWDTGATQTLISSDIATELKLIKRREGVADTAGGSKKCWETNYAVFFPDLGTFSITALVMDGLPPKHVSIGMDIIKYGISIIDVIKLRDKEYFRLRFTPVSFPVGG